MDEVSGTLKNEYRNENENDDDETHTACGWLADTGSRSLCWLGERILIYILWPVLVVVATEGGECSCNNNDDEEDTTCRRETLRCDLVASRSRCRRRFVLCHRRQEVVWGGRSSRFGFASFGRELVRPPGRRSSTHIYRLEV